MYKIVALVFVVHKLAKFHQSWYSKFYGLVHFLTYIRDNKNFGLNYYADMKDSPLYDLLRQNNIKTENQLVDFSDSSWKYCLDNGRSTGVYNNFYQGGEIDHYPYVPGPVAQSIAQIGYKFSTHFSNGFIMFQDVN